jgi:hypothetical protein
VFCVNSVIAAIFVMSGSDIFIVSVYVMCVLPHVCVYVIVIVIVIVIVVDYTWLREGRRRWSSVFILSTIYFYYQPVFSCSAVSYGH